MLLPCVKCYRYSDEDLEIRIGPHVLKERICHRCRDEIHDQLQAAVMNWTLDFFQEKLLHHCKTPYNSLYVTESETSLHLRSHISLQSGIYKHTWGTPCDYLNTFLIGPLLTAPVEKLLVVGLGSGFLVRLFRRFFPAMQIDAVEIDEEVVRIAEEYFDFPVDDPNIRVQIRDAREYIEHSPIRDYDLVVLDAYRVYEVPEHLNTADFFRRVHAVIRPGGVLMTNLHGRLSGEHAAPVLAAQEKIKPSFPHSAFFPSPIDWNLNIMLAASDRPLPHDLSERATRMPKEMHDLIAPYLPLRSAPQ